MISAPEGPFCPVLAGPTAVGKTDLVLRLAGDFPLEVISLDSRQIYRGLRIGTAQPTAEDLRACPHHLIDFLPPEETWSAQAFRESFCELYTEIRSRGGIPLIVGGAGLYLSALNEGFFRIDTDPQGLQALREDLDPLTDIEIRERLLKVDPGSHRRIHANDRYRSQRALEILALTGRTMSEMLADRQPDPALGLEFPLVVLDRDRAELRRRVALRLDRMIAGGWMEETQHLLEAHDPAAPGLRTLGYRQLIEFLRGTVNLPQAREQIILRTGQYAKRQQTWFGARPRLIGGAPEDPAILATLRHLLDAAGRSHRT